VSVYTRLNFFSFSIRSVSCQRRIGDKFMIELLVFYYILLFSLLSLFWRNKRRLVRSPCCLWVCLCIPTNSWKPPIVARQRFNKHFPTAANTHFARIVFRAVHVVSKESSWSILSSTSCCTFLFEISRQTQSLTAVEVSSVFVNVVTVADISYCYCTAEKLNVFP
jgi:hypothetical protein